MPRNLAKSVTVE